MNTRLTLVLTALVSASGIAISCAHAPPPQLPALRAPGSPQVEVGQRVRARWGVLRYVGNITALSADSMFILMAARQSVALPLDDVERLDVSRGRRHRGVVAGAGKGALTGAIVGGALSVYGFLVCHDYTCLSAAAWAPLGVCRRETGA
jgi:hypothetical protein